MSFFEKNRNYAKKKTYRSEKIATEESQTQRLEYWDRIRDIPEKDLIFIDETGFWTGMSRRVARSLKGRKAFNLRPFYKGEKLTLIGAMDREGMVATKTVKGSMKGKDFNDFIKTELLPKLREGHVIVMDNLNIHKMEGIQELIAEKGARIEYLPPYSPDFNPIEMLWSTLKAFVRRFPLRMISGLEKLIEIGLYLIGKSFFRNWFIKCCYCTR